ncbi:hypothetical protein PNOK_0295200 [Pyrrhoderma noxium]|uniref:DASH complex subunit DAD2 n=1 Tax=Pyrrhoderma noxium TaxID=2282107 RepID=A0A286ULJ2_9AGAM|nr:hypothetical protein PNOK_0295200 [Pyrrhoderma noxium]
MRKSSVYSVRASHAGSLASQSSSAQAEAILLEKKKEHDALLALERVSNEYLRRLEAIDYDCNIMADAGRVHGEVLSQWPEMFRILSLSVPSLNPQSKPDGEAQNNIAQQNCERLVRVPIDELQERQSSKL